MSNVDVRPKETRCHAAGEIGPVIELLDARDVPLGGGRAMRVSRTLPNRRIPTVGAWCFLDHFGPEHTDMRVLPHPHTGLQTVTWPIHGEIRHRDSIGSDVVVKPSQLNLMTSGVGVSHSEISLGHSPMIHGLQLWVALPKNSDDVPPAFEQHTDLPLYETPGLHGTVVVGDLAGVSSPATTYTALLGAELDIEPGADTTIPLRGAYEHAILVLDGTVTVEGTTLERGPLLYLGMGRHDLRFSSAAGAKIFLLGGEPFPDDLVMWWNFVGRSHDDIVAARDEWEHAGQQRFGFVAGHDGERIPAPPIPPLRLTPRRGRSQQ